MTINQRSKEKIERMAAMSIETEINCKDVCAGKIKVPTDKEVAALKEMRTIKTKVKAIKEDIRTLNESGDEKARDKALALEKDLERYKVKWKEWQQKHKEAVRERMVILGHEE